MYRISEEHIGTLLMEGHQDTYSQGRFTYTKDVPGFKYPLKVIVQKEGDTCTIITAYPLKRREMKNESVL